MSASEIKQSFEVFIQHLSEHPEECRSSDGTVTASLEEGLRFRAEGPRGALISDMPKALGGAGSAPSPAWLFRAALAACKASAIAVRAARTGVALATLEVTVESESDDRGFTGMDDNIPAGPLNMHTRVRIGAPGATPEQLREIVAWADEHSYVGKAVERAIPSTLETEVV